MSELKLYQLATHNEQQWDELHAELTGQGNVNACVPDRCVECADDQLHSATRGVYKLTETEYETLKNDPRIAWINIDYRSYPEIYAPPADELHATSTQFNRWTNAVKVVRVIPSFAVPPDSTDINRTGYQSLVPVQEFDPWVGVAPDTASIFSQIPTYGTGKNVDVIVADDGMWFGHPEFQRNPRVNGTNAAIELPYDYVGGNKLPGNGTCDLLDLVLDSPYYIDPAWFNANPAARLTTRWDGTTVPVESVARTWWGDGSQRSSQFSAIGTVGVPSNYTRAANNGSNAAISQVGQHGTPCCALTFGRTQGWAYNANKWAFNMYNTFGAGIEQGFDIVKLFHLYKPNNSVLGTKDPTVMSNSWGYRANKDPNGATWYYNFRNDVNVAYTTETGIPWLSNMGTQGDAGRWKSEMKPNSLTQALDELIGSGVIFVAAAGNSNQKQTKWNSPDYNNYITTTNGGSLLDSEFTEFGIPVYGTVNRRGFPQQGGKTILQSGEVIYPVINIGALDDQFVSGKGAKVGYSDRGNDIDAYTPADGTLAANHSYTSVGARADTYPGYTYSSTATDCSFGGTSAACPVAAGFIAGVLEFNRDWAWTDVKSLIAGLTTPNTEGFYYGVESTTPTTSNWFDYPGLEGGTPKRLYQFPPAYDVPTGTYAFSSNPSTINEGSSGTFVVATTGVTEATTLYWTVEHITTVPQDFFATVGSFQIFSNSGNFLVDTIADSLTEGPQTFRVQVRTGSTSGPVVLTSPTITIADTSTAATYSLSSTISQITEASTPVTITLTTTNVAPGTLVPYTISGGGITAAEIGLPSLQGNFTISGGTGTVTLTATWDDLVEFTEVLTLQLDNQLAFINIPIIDIVVYASNTVLVPTGIWYNRQASGSVYPRPVKRFLKYS